jgi:hypothetical protein
MSTTSHETEHHVAPSEGDRPVESMPSLTFGLIAAPGLPAEIAAGLERELPQLLAARYPGISWVVTATEDALVSAGSSGVEVIDATRRRLLERDWDLAVCLTDRPLLTGRRPVLADASAAHNAGAISLPALGAVNLRRRTRDLIIDMVDTLLG